MRTKKTKEELHALSVKGGQTTAEKIKKKHQEYRQYVKEITGASGIDSLKAAYYAMIGRNRLYKETPDSEVLKTLSIPRNRVFRKSDIIELMCDLSKGALPKIQVTLLVNTFILILQRVLLRGGVIQVREIGKFQLVPKAPKNYSITDTSDKPIGRRLKFTPSKYFNALVSQLKPEDLVFRHEEESKEVLRDLLPHYMKEIKESYTDYPDGNPNKDLHGDDLVFEGDVEDDDLGELILELGDEDDEEDTQDNSTVPEEEEEDDINTL